MARTNSSIVRHFDRSSGKMGRSLSFTGSCSTRPVTVFVAFFFVAISLLCHPLEHRMNATLRHRQFEKEKSFAASYVFRARFVKDVSDFRA
jgi:hypothetical protein